MFKENLCIAIFACSFMSFYWEVYLSQLEEHGYFGFFGFFFFFKFYL